MKKKIILLSSALTIAAALVTFISASTNDAKASLLMQNVEALAQEEWHGWKKGYAMGKKAHSIGKNPNGELEIRYVDCCLSYNQNTACDLSAQHEDCYK